MEGMEGEARLTIGQTLAQLDLVQQGPVDGLVVEPLVVAGPSLGVWEVVVEVDL